jgi:glycosyltransferase involved in cell wall biosynthesis
MADNLFIGQFNDSYKPIMDGVGVCVENYTRWIHEKHGTAVAVVPSEPGFEDSDEFEVIRYASIPFLLLQPYRIGTPWLRPRVGRRLRQLPFSLLHSHSPFVAGRMARRIARARKIPHVSTFHSKYRDDAIKALRSEWAADIVVKGIVRFYRSVDAVWSPSESTAAVLREYGYDGEIRVAPNGSDMPIPSEAEYSALRRRGEEFARIRPGEFVFLFVGQHRWEKNVGLIIRATAKLLELTKDESAGRPFRLVFAGEGYAAAGMAKLARETGIDRVTTFLGKVVDREALKSLFARGDLFLFPSVYDNAPLVMREAAAFGLPTVAAAGSATAEIIEDGDNGFVTENDPDALARRMKLLMGQEELLRRVGLRASRTIYRSWEDIVDWAVTEYERIMERFF